MRDNPEAFLHILRYVWGSMFICIGLVLLIYIISSFSSARAQEQSMGSSNVLLSGASDSPNVVTSGLAAVASDLSSAGKSIETVGTAISDGVMSVGLGIAKTGGVIGYGLKIGTVTALQVTGKTAAFIGSSIMSGVSAIGSVPGKVVGFVSDTTVVKSITRPSDSMEVPIIDPNSPDLAAAIAALPPAAAPSPAPAQVNQGPIWPMVGRVTADFGVNHRPFQRRHSGIDIIDGKPSGTTPIKPFRPGRVIETIRSRSGFGNYVIVDHGSGVTSLYAHLASIAVAPGQEVNIESVLGFAGSTGTSTGTHLHFEIRVNGQATNPRKFIEG